MPRKTWCLDLFTLQNVSAWHKVLYKVFILFNILIEDRNYEGVVYASTETGTSQRQANQI